MISRAVLINAYFKNESNKKKVKQISNIQYPAPLKNILKSFKNILKSFKIEKGSYDVEAGTIKISDISEDQRIAFHFFYFITEINELIENLNFVLEDLYKLSKNPLLFSHTPFKRYKFCIRMFFYEFARSEDIMNRFLYGLEKFNFITKKMRKELIV